MNKKWGALIGCFFMMLCVGFMDGRDVYAAETLKTVSETKFTFGYHSMNDYYDDFYSGEKEILVLNKEAEDVTYYFLTQTEQLYASGNIEAIKEIMMVVLE